jgi:hypothetical protein
VTRRLLAIVSSSDKTREELKAATVQEGQLNQNDSALRAADTLPLGGAYYGSRSFIDSPVEVEK